MRTPSALAKVILVVVGCALPGCANDDPGNGGTDPVEDGGAPRAPDGSDRVDLDAGCDADADVDASVPPDAMALVDRDGDGVADADDRFSDNPNERADSDGDGVGDASDAFPNDPTETVDANADGIGDNAQSLYTTLDEPAGANCANGGTATLFGLDGNADGVLQPAEVVSARTFYSCSPQRFTVGGTVTGLPPSADPLALFGSGELSDVVTQSGSFTLGTVTTGTAYDVSVGVQPADRYCEAARGAPTRGTVTSSAVTNLAFVCYRNGEVITHTDWLTSGVAVDAQGNVITGDYAIRKTTRAGVTTRFAGVLGAGYADGPADTARFNLIADVAVDKDGNIYAADELNRTVRKIDALGNVTTIAGNFGVPAGHSDGPGTSVFRKPTALTVDTVGNVYVIDDQRLRRIAPNGSVTTLTTAGSFAPNPASPVSVAMSDLTVDPRTNEVYVAYTFGSDGLVMIVAPSGATALAGFSYASDQYRAINGLDLDARGNLYVSDTLNGRVRIRRLSPASRGVVFVNQNTNLSEPIATVLESGNLGALVDGTGPAARFSNQVGHIAVDAQGHVYVADTGNVRVRKVHFVLGDIPPPAPPARIVIDLNDPNQLGEELLEAFHGSPAVTKMLAELQADWNAAAYGPLPAAGTLMDFAWEACREIERCVTPGDAMEHLVVLTRETPVWNLILSAWADLRRSAGWGGFAPLGVPVCTGSAATGNLYCSTSIAVALNSPRVPDTIEQALWRSATAPSNLLKTLSLLQGVTEVLAPEDPDYGVSAIDALKRLGQPTPLARGLETVLLFQEAKRIAHAQREGSALTADETTFAATLVGQMIDQERSALSQLKVDFGAFQTANIPPAQQGGIFYVGTPPTEGQQRALVSLIPSSSVSPAIDDTTTIAFRLLDAIGRSQDDSSSSAPLIAGIGVGVPLAGAAVSIGSGIALSAALAQGTVRGLATLMSSVASASASTAGALVAGPAALVVSAVVMLGSGAAIVAQVNEYRDLMNAFDATLRSYATAPPTLGALTNRASSNSYNGLVFGSDTQVLFGVANVATP